MDHDTQNILARVSANILRRAFGCGALVGLGAVLIYVSVFQDLGLVAQTLLLTGGVLSLWVAQLTWRGTASTVELRPEGLFDADGTLIAAVDNIAKVERGAFAMKPSNGFALRLRRADTFKWRQGLWWRYGTKVGVGGMTPVHQSKLMAERLAQLVEEVEA